MERKKLKEIPKFKNEGEEREFWWTHDFTEYFDWGKAEVVVFPRLKLTKQKLTELHNSGQKPAGVE